MSLMARIADGLACGIPASQGLARRAALLPPALRGRMTYRLSAALARRVVLPELVETNMGIDARLRCVVPRASLMTLYGSPRLYDGERGALELAAWWCREAEAFVDIGAHLGYFSFFVRARLGAQLPIYFFEADEALYRLLWRNIERCGMPNVVGSPDAIAARSGESVFFRNISDPLSGSLAPMFSATHNVQAVPVKTVAFADFAQAHRLRKACVKVDVEGAEQQFLDGAAGALDAVDGLIMELLKPAIDDGIVNRICRQSGWHAYYINDMRLEHSAQGAFRYNEGQYNWLFCREDPGQLRRRLDGSRMEVQ